MAEEEREREQLSDAVDLSNRLTRYMYMLVEMYYGYV